ncbi:MAG: ATP-dependent DNA helicase [Olavius algarvensis Delta 4 endosymbiont]|nr:MAG: ATP-dependent DNA helicase [Olavius algarvensis Delta 4 endosymbiont]
MGGPKRHYHRHRKKYVRKKPRILKIKPGADASLKTVFAGIGKPPQKPFTPDDFQIDAVAAVKTSDCLVTAPTGAGKTWIAEQSIAAVLKDGGRAWYASPLKALTNAKYAEFGELFGKNNVGILTGDRKENPDAPVITGTTEILRNQLYDAMHRGETLDTSFVILDEAHFLGDPDRGVVWEEIMIYLPARIPLLMLSATINNADQIAAWLENLRAKPCTVIPESQRPVPLAPLFFHPSGTLMPLTVPGKPGKNKRLFKKVHAYVATKNPPQLAPPRKLPPFGEMLKVLRKYQLLPAIFFLKSRADCDNALELCRQNSGHPQDRLARLADRIEELTAASSHTADHRHKWHLENLAVGAHHSGQLPAWKIVLETLMTEGLLDAVFATSTVAAGVNFPARTVVFFNSDRFNGTEFLPLTPTEFHQMTGRAGRRGMDKIGFVVAVPGRFMDIRAAAQLMSAPPSNVMSQIRINFSMVLNLLLSHAPSQVRDLLERSFAAYQITDKVKGKRLRRYVGYGQRHLIEDFNRHLEFLRHHKYVANDGTLTEDGQWASRLRVDQPLLIAEGFRHGIFPDTDPALLAAIMAIFVFEREADEKLEKKLVAKSLRKLYQEFAVTLSPFIDEMAGWGFETRVMYLRPAAALHAWARGFPWEFIIEISGLEEGNLVMLILRTADNLRHIRALKDIFPEAAASAGEAIDLLLKDPVQTTT